MSWDEVRERRQKHEPELAGKRLNELTAAQLSNYIFDQNGLGFCGCGTPAKTIDLLRDVLECLSQREIAMYEHTPEGDAEYDRQTARLGELLGGEASALYWHYLYWLSARELTEHGGNCRTSWLHPDGSDLLLALQRFTTEELIDPDEADEQPTQEGVPGGCTVRELPSGLLLVEGVGSDGGAS